MCELKMARNASVNRDEIAAMYRNGMSQRDIARAMAEQWAGDAREVKDE